MGTTRRQDCSPWQAGAASGHSFKILRQNSHTVRFTTLRGVLAGLSRAPRASTVSSVPAGGWMVWVAHPSLGGCRLGRLRLEAPLPRWGSQGPTPLDPHAESRPPGPPHVAWFLSSGSSQGRRTSCTSAGFPRARIPLSRAESRDLT